MFQISLKLLPSYKAHPAHSIEMQARKVTQEFVDFLQKSKNSIFCQSARIEIWNMEITLEVGFLIQLVQSSRLHRN